MRIPQTLEIREAGYAATHVIGLICEKLICANLLGNGWAT